MLQHLPERTIDKKDKPLQTPKLSIVNVATMHGHDPILINGRLACKNCLLSAPNGVKAKNLANNPCIIPPDQHNVRIEPVKYLQCVHISHKMHVLKGLYFCMSCGAVLGKRIDKLGLPCLPPTDYGYTNIRRLKKGKLPVGRTSWPSDDSVPEPLPPIAEGPDPLQCQIVLYDPVVAAVNAANTQGSSSGACAENTRRDSGSGSLNDDMAYLARAQHNIMDKNTSLLQDRILTIIAASKLINSAQVLEANSAPKVSQIPRRDMPGDSSSD